MSILLFLCYSKTKCWNYCCTYTHRNQVLEPARSIYGIVVFMVLMFLVFFTSCVVLFPESPMRAAHHLVPGFNEATFTIFFNTNMSIGTISLERKVVLMRHSYHQSTTYFHLCSVTGGKQLTSHYSCSPH